MTYLQEPQGIDAFAEGLSSFDNQEIAQPSQSEPTAAVQSASLDINKPQAVRRVTIAEPVSDDEENIVDKLKVFYEENQTMILASLAIGIGYYVYKKQQK